MIVVKFPIEDNASVIVPDIVTGVAVMLTPPVTVVPESIAPLVPVATTVVLISTVFVGTTSLAPVMTLVPVISLVAALSVVLVASLVTAGSTVFVAIDPSVAVDTGAKVGVVTPVAPVQADKSIVATASPTIFFKVSLSMFHSLPISNSTGNLSVEQVKKS
jgi:hypothetical protein